MLVILPLLGFLGILLNLRISDGDWDLRLLILRTSVIWADHRSTNHAKLTTCSDP